MGEVISVIFVPTSPKPNPAMENLKRQNEEMRKRAQELSEKEEELRKRELEKKRQEETIKRREEELKRREEDMRKEQEEELRRREQDMKKREENIQKTLEEDAKRRNEESKIREQDLKEMKDLAREIARQVEAVTKALSVIQGKQESIRSQTRPTSEQIEAIKKARQYKEGYFHFAIAGMTGCGKSSLINAFRGLKDNEPNSAKTGTVETTKEITRYPDQSWFTRGKFVWYDVPGCGTLDTSGEEYFNTQGLYVFDAIIVAVDVRFSPSDIAIIKNCIRWNIPWYLVRSKADQHIENIAQELIDHNADNGNAIDGTYWKNEAREKHIADTRQQFEQILSEAELPTEDVYIVSSSKLRMCVNKRSEPAGSIDEWELLRDLIRDVFERRVVRSAGSNT